VALECKHVWDYISEFLDDSLPAATRVLVQKHLETCEICSAILDSTRNILILTADDRVFELPAGYSQRLHARLAREIHAANSLPKKPIQNRDILDQD
jgi:anti-sigma factor RsiW